MIDRALDGSSDVCETRDKSITMTHAHADCPQLAGKRRRVYLVHHPFGIYRQPASYDPQETINDINSNGDHW
jgi:hypothetical protein